MFGSARSEMANFPNFYVPENRDLSTGSNFNPRNTQCIPLVKIIAFLELEKIISFLNGHSLITKSKKSKRAYFEIKIRNMNKSKDR